MMPKSTLPLSLLPIMSKLIEKLLVKRLGHLIEGKKLIPVFQFGFLCKRSTIDQLNRITDVLEYTVEEKHIALHYF